MIKTKGKRTKKFILFIIILIISALFVIILTKLKRPAPPPPTVSRKKPKIPEKKIEELTKIAIIIDDVGYKNKNVNDFLEFRGKLTFSVLPLLPNSNYYAGLFHSRGFEIMIHIPMQPINYPRINPGFGALLVSDSTEKIIKKLNTMIEKNPYAVGANNHMGSKLTQDCRAMTAVMKTLKEHRLFFIDSLTTSKSCAYKIALDTGIKTAKRDVFLDNKNDYIYIKTQFRKLIDISKKRGYAIGIGHIQNDKTIMFLKDILPLQNKYGFEFVFVSEILNN